MKTVQLVFVFLASILLLFTWAVQSHAGDDRDHADTGFAPIFGTNSAMTMNDFGSSEKIKIGPIAPDSLPDDRKRYRVPELLSPVQLDSAIQADMLAQKIAGLSATIVVGDSIVWRGAYGYADAARTIPVADTTLFLLASISKTFVATGILQLWEHGLIELDADVNQYLPFQIRNPSHPDVPITVRMMLAHVSSIARRDEVWIPDLVWGQDCSIPLEPYVKDHIGIGGPYYSPYMYLAGQLGTAGEYCNWAFSALGLIIEHISGLSLEQYLQDSVWSPLGMHNTSWFLRNLDTNNIAMPMRYVSSSAGWQAYGHAGIPVYPAGQVRTSSIQLAKQLSAFLGHGEVDGVRILDSTVVDSLMTVQFPGTTVYPGWEWGLGWYRRPGYPNGWMWGHEGGMSGALTYMFCSPPEQTGVIMLTNSDYRSGDWQTFLKLWEFSRDMDGDGVIAGFDNCPGAFNPGQEDLDHDGYGDACEPDVDHDGILTAADNCPNKANAGQEDANHDGIGDACCCFFKSGNVDCDPGEGVDISDLATMIDYMYISFTPLCCTSEANTDGQPGIDIADLAALIDYLYISFTPPAACQ